MKVALCKICQWCDSRDSSQLFLLYSRVLFMYLYIYFAFAFTWISLNRFKRKTSMYPKNSDRGSNLILILYFSQEHENSGKPVCSVQDEHSSPA